MSISDDPLEMTPEERQYKLRAFAMKTIQAIAEKAMEMIAKQLEAKEVKE